MARQGLIDDAGYDFEPTISNELSYDEGYKQGYDDAINDFEKIVFNGTLHQIARMIASGDIPKDIYQKWLSETHIGFMTPIEICREIIAEQLKEGANNG